jgi:hypothetical protein
MKAVSKRASIVLDNLTGGLGPGDARTYDNAPGDYMAVHVERVEETALGAVYSVAHYYEQSGDLVPDPDVTFLRGLDGAWYPLSFQNAIAYRRAAEVRGGQILVKRREQRDLASFANVLLRNIEQQQGITPAAGAKCVLRRDGRVVARGTEQELCDWLHRNHSFSAAHALAHEGYSISPDAGEPHDSEDGGAP